MLRYGKEFNLTWPDERFLKLRGQKLQKKEEKTEKKSKIFFPLCLSCGWKNISFLCHFLHWGKEVWRSYADDDSLIRPLRAWNHLKMDCEREKIFDWRSTNKGYLQHWFVVWNFSLKLIGGFFLPKWSVNKTSLSMLPSRGGFTNWDLPLGLDRVTSL